MTPPHSIRLRGAWAAAADGTHARNFGWPSALDPHERVWLVAAALTGPGSVSVNGVRVGELPAGAAAFAADITPLLRPRNELVVALPPGTAVGDVALEVRAAGVNESVEDVTAELGGGGGAPA
jgi:hypothetical protein